MAIFLFLAIRNYNIEPFNWVPVVMLSGYIIAAGIGNIRVVHDFNVY